LWQNFVVVVVYVYMGKEYKAVILFQRKEIEKSFTQKNFILCQKGFKAEKKIPFKVVQHRNKKDLKEHNGCCEQNGNRKGLRNKGKEREETIKKLFENKIKPK
jgi:hypothetical protein